ncbi:TRIM2_3 [Mytilus coruscus]|uniref:TRIM2_3 n=1 Tax=Mytilus coruscus TaxID=42192 RepID=A0A6J8D910_MYTCO|nr:TRIM2_3 [Mytilus coruscus]
MATSIESHVVDITTCAICLEKLNIPKYLPCLHTFCESCLRTYITAIFEKEHKQSIECPVCRTTVTISKEVNTPDEWAKVLPLNFLIVGLLEKEKLRDHKTMHGEELKLFCADHHTPCCSMCVSIHHRRCAKVLSIEDAAMEYAKSDEVKYLKTHLANVDYDVKVIIKDRSSAKENIDKDYKRKQRDLEVIFSDLVAKINDLKVRREAELLKIYNEVKETIDTTLIFFQNKQKNIENEKQIIDAAVNMASNVQVMIEVEKLKKQVEEHKQVIQSKTKEIVNYELLLQDVENITKLAEQMEKACQISCKKPNTYIALSSVTVTPNVSEIFSCCRFGQHTCSWGVKGAKQDAICVSLSKEIELYGLLSYVCKDALATCDVTATVKDDTTDLVVVKDTIDSKVAENNTVKIMFPKPVKLLANKKYHVVVVMKGTSWCYAGGDGETVVDSNGVVFTFNNSPLSNNGTNTNAEQIPGFVFKISDEL